MQSICIHIRGRDRRGSEGADARGQLVTIAGRWDQRSGEGEAESAGATYSKPLETEFLFEKRYTMPVVLLKWYTIPPSVQGARTTLKENNSSVAKQ